MNMNMSASSGLQLFDPVNIVMYLSFFSPIIVATCITGLSFVFQNFKGLIYLAFLLACCVSRNFVYMLSGGSPAYSDGTICTAIQYSKYGNPTFSTFVFAFTITYMAYPMFANSSVNWWTFSSLLAYFLMDIFIKMYNGCTKNASEIVLNTILGSAAAAFIVSMMYLGGSGKYLFFNETSSDKNVCYKPDKQTFKCSVYKNGELVSTL